MSEELEPSLAEKYDRRENAAAHLPASTLCARRQLWSLSGKELAGASGVFSNYKAVLDLWSGGEGESKGEGKAIPGEQNQKRGWLGGGVNQQSYK